MKEAEKKIRRMVIMMILLCLLTSTFPITAFAKSTSPQTNYGVACCNCHEYDYMNLIGFEQVGIGGTMYQLIYSCSNCGAVTYQTFYARKA